jgi:hypothetical protein
MRCRAKRLRSRSGVVILGKMFMAVAGGDVMWNKTPAINS